MQKRKLNCWEFKNCGREPNGSNVDKLGPCPAAIFTPTNGFRGGINGGRACVYITGTFCDEEIQGLYLEKKKQCLQCDFFRLLIEEELLEPGVNHFHDYAIKKGGAIEK